MTMVGKTKHLSASRLFARGSDLKVQRMSSVLSVSLVLFMTTFSVIAVRGFSTISVTDRGGISIPSIPTTLSRDWSNAIDKGIITQNSKSAVLMAGLFGEQTKAKNQNNTHISPTSDWQIYVDQSKPSIDRGGDAIFDAFFSLCDTYVEGNDLGTDGKGDVEVQIIPAILPKPASGGKPPWIRCVWNVSNKKDVTRPSPNLDVSNVDSVEKVYRVLTKHIGMKEVSIEACVCLKLKYKGNAFLESGQIKPAIDAYNEALEICGEFSVSSSDSNTSSPESYNSIVLKQQKGLILLLRASAFLQQAQLHKEVLQMTIAGDEKDIPNPEILQSLLSENLSSYSPTPASDSSFSERALDGAKNNENGGVSTALQTDENDSEGATVELISEEGDVTVSSGEEDGIGDSSSSPPLPSMDEMDTDSEEARASLNEPQTSNVDGSARKDHLRKIQYRHGLYQMSLLQAVRDALQATEVLPSYPTAWLRAGDLLSDLWKIKESRQYYEKALSLDESLEEDLSPILEGLQSRQELVDRVRADKKWPEDSLQMALDIST